ncbi:glycogen/starch synthase, partial [Micromonospora sp. NPDC000207]|uniref:glycogen/starch synthase n=1 Tax=Micromonospora sp. NPDC000207 TaxID=3154246 RepID=UPI0033193602
MTTLRVGEHLAHALEQACRPHPTSRHQVPQQPAEPGGAGRRSRILMLSWEYPPVLVGGLGRHVHALSVALAAAG